MKEQRFFNRNSEKIHCLPSAFAENKRLVIFIKILPRILVGKKQMTAKFLWFYPNAQNIYNIFFLPSKIDNFQVTHSLKAFYSIGRNNCHQVNGSAMWLRSLYKHEGHSRPKKPWGNHCILALRPFKWLISKVLSIIFTEWKTNETKGQKVFIGMYWFFKLKAYLI